MNFLEASTSLVITSSEKWPNPVRSVFAFSKACLFKGRGTNYTSVGVSLWFEIVERGTPRIPTNPTHQFTISWHHWTHHRTCPNYQNRMKKAKARLEISVCLKVFVGWFLVVTFAGEGTTISGILYQRTMNTVTMNKLFYQVARLSHWKR